MPVRNIWSLQPGECIVAEEIMKKLSDVEVYFPMRDVGIDLLVVKGLKHIGIQVKESRYYYSRKWKDGHIGHSWHQVKKARFLKNKDRIDFYIFLTYKLAETKTRRYFDHRFLIVPYSKLEKRMDIKDAGKSQIYSFCFHFEGSKAWDERVTVELSDPLTDYSEFLNAWNLIEKKVTRD